MPKRDIVENLLKRLFAGEDKYLLRQIAQLNDANNQELQRSAPGFIFRGGTFWNDAAVDMQHQGSNVNYRTSLKLPRLSLFLSSQGDQLHAKIKQRHREHDTIGQLLTVMLQPASSSQAVVDALPECLVQLLPNLANWRARHPRQQEAGALLQAHNPAAYVIYLKWLPQIEAYSVNHLFE